MHLNAFFFPCGDSETSYGEGPHEVKQKCHPIWVPGSDPIYFIYVKRAHLKKKEKSEKKTDHPHFKSFAKRPSTLAEYILRTIY